ncbi:hypothetical protein KGMB01110_29060 [Mediterraneibacter butyricigenes]|uniref:Uncharacterized protein n=1 Tax=Mediterraneibacter butyricigenes TaxID=2316025 RepID=A0A391P567_9FIRM|nr:hypothetical protein KGMB01110_29060 [Mediterraneibacter butyricigenes]
MCRISDRKGLHFCKIERTFNEMQAIARIRREAGEEQWLFSVWLFRDCRGKISLMGSMKIL